LDINYHSGFVKFPPIKLKYIFLHKIYIIRKSDIMAVTIDESLNIRINGKIVYFTIHVRNEIDDYDKDTLFVCDVVDKG